jgi:hypothetical protein
MEFPRGHDMYVVFFYLRVILTDTTSLIEGLGRRVFVARPSKLTGLCMTPGVILARHS